MNSIICKHKWETKEKVVLPSAWEQMGEKVGGLKTVTVFDHMFVKKVIIILVCTECGKLDKTIEES